MIVLKSAKELERMRRAGWIVREAHREVQKAIRPGVTTKELDRIADRVIRKHGAIPSFKGYNGFPGSICTSVNDELVHGIPGTRVLREGDIISIDIGAQYEGYHGDSAWTYPVGRISEAAQKLLRVTEESLYRGLAKAVPGARIGDISHAIASVAREAGLRINTQFGGHGVGRTMHGDPHVPNDGRPGRGYKLQPGLVIAIEPWFLHTTDEIFTDPDGWTLRSADGSRGAHMEHTVAITDGEPIVLTARG